jgi:TPR repeat protein
MAVTIGKSGSLASTASAQPKFVTASVEPQGNSVASSGSSMRSTSRKRPPMRPAQERAILNKAAVLIDANDVASARLLFEYAANRGSAKAALAMGQTFDPAFFHAAEIIGLRPNPQKAKAWYQRAAALGNKEAQKRLSALGTR